MSSVLHIAASPKGEVAYSWLVAKTLLDRIDPAGERSVRRLDQEPPPFPDADFTRDMIAAQTAEAAAVCPSLTISEQLIGELEATDVLVISTPMHNFTLPAALKAWLDQIVRFGRTFRSTPDGKIGLLADRPTYIVIASGGAMSEPAARQPDFLRPYLTAILDCIGIRDITFITVEGMSRGEYAVAAGLKAAHAAINVALERPSPIPT
jgi:FMN-dependent NADH-azoreductase